MLLRPTVLRSPGILAKFCLFLSEVTKSIKDKEEQENGKPCHSFFWPADFINFGMGIQ